MRRGDECFRRGASSRRCNVVDDRMKRALGEAAVEAEVEDPVKRTPAETAEAGVDELMKRALREAAAAKAEVDDQVKRALGEVAEEVVAHVTRVASGYVYASVLVCLWRLVDRLLRRLIPLAL